VPKFLTQEQVDTYWRHGFLSPVDMTPEDEKLGLRREFERVEADYDSMHYMVKPHLVTGFCTIPGFWMRSRTSSVPT
tara:strand:+ start:1580 stop:1810 length:231 start_codon:yes stop_codon:yes gene_type:complete